MNRHLNVTGWAMMALALSACGKTDSTSVSTPLTNSVSLIQKAVSTTGTKMGASSLASAKVDPTVMSVLSVTPLVHTMCDAHGRPQMPSGEGGGDMPQSDSRYPGVATYCALTVDDGDTVIGGFELARSLICSLENAGIVFSGTAQSLTLDFTNTTCWPNGGPETGVSTLPVTATGTAPAVFNTHYEKGVSFNVPSLGLDFKIAANIDGDKIEFIAYESWSGTAAGDSAGNNGMMAGEITKSTGVLKFEKRDERIRSGCTSGSCGWNRHTRLIANLVMSGGEPSDLVSFEYGNGGVWVSSAALADGTATTSNGTVITAKGAIASEIKARMYSASNKTTAQLKTVGQWSETTNTSCVSGAGVSSSDCSTQTGIGMFTSSTKFNLFASSAQTSPSTWLSTFSGFNFTAVDLDVDNAF